MPNNRATNEEYQAELSKRRGIAASGVTDPAAKKRFIARQGSGTATDAELESETSRVTNVRALKGK